MGSRPVDGHWEVPDDRAVVITTDHDARRFDGAGLVSA
jgi:hypothetical protein